MGTVWVLTESYNDYDQYGEYLSAVWLEKPTRDDLKKVGITWEVRLDLLLSDGGGGRIDTEHRWFDLSEVPLGERY